MAAPPFKVKAVYDYSSPHDDDLNFPTGQIITVTEKEDEDWYIGEYTDASGLQHSGLFPKNFVEEYQPPVPSRPTRAARPAQDVRSPPPPAPVSAPAPAAAPEAEPETSDQEERDQEAAPPPPVQSKPAPPPVETPASPPPQQAQPAVRSPPSALQASDRQAASTAPKAAPEKKAPPPVSEKPSSFKDRIAAFNKPAAAPVTPFKPTGAQPSFIKKPFVAPPPSSNAYIPPPRAEPVQKVYRREEDPEIKEKEEQDRADAERAGLIPQDSSSAPAVEGEDGEEAPKPQSLKERIAMLQKQQMEQAARRADVSQKEKPKKPLKKATTDDSLAEASAPPPLPAARPADDDDDVDAEPAQRASMDATAPLNRTRSANRSSTLPPSRSGTGLEPDMQSDANDADMSAADEMTAEENEGDYDEAQPAQPARKSIESPRAPAAPRREPDVGEEEGAAEEDGEEAEAEAEDEEEEEDEMDAETRRRLELRERMAKMSGGMGMAGMFGPPGGMPMPSSKPPPKKKSTAQSARSEDSEQPMSPTTAPPIPMFPIPGMQSVRSPEPEVTKEEEHGASITGERGPMEVPDVEDVKPQPATRASIDRAVPPLPKERPLSSPTVERAAPPPLPTDRPVLPPAESRAVPPRPPVAAVEQSDSEGSASDDELSSRANTMPPPIPTAARPAEQRSPPLPANKRASYFGSDVTSPTSPTSPGTSEKRASRAIPPIPGTGPLSPGLSRAPPPPPPTAEPFAQAPPIPKPPVEELAQEESEYEGDYDTDIASSVKRKDALKSHNRDMSESTIADENMPLSPPPVPFATVPRAVPPPPPQHAPARMSMDAPRVAPPPPPPARDLDPEDEDEDEDEDYDHAPSHALPIRSVPPPPPVGPAPPPVAPTRKDSSDDLYSASPPRRSMDRPPPPPPHAAPTQGDRSMPPTPSSQVNVPPFSPPTRTSTRQSMDVPRVSMSARRSMDQSRGGTHDGFIATDVDMAEGSQWWAQRDLPPPVFQNRPDVLVEVEESQTSRRGGKTIVSKDVYVLFMDYSQTVITARFDSREPSDVSFEQRHEPPPSRLRQDQLENYWQQYGARIADAASGKKDSVVGDGSPHALILDLIRPCVGALLPIGTRAYGALVYANLANASVQQFDEIRAGDIITLRNAKLQGKHGTMHQKYSMDVGMQGREHVAIVADWDGTKKKIRAWEQGREKAKVRLESFRLGDLKSGEVRVWRVVGRTWVGWETGN